MSQFNFLLVLDACIALHSTKITPHRCVQLGSFDLETDGCDMHALQLQTD